MVGHGQATKLKVADMNRFQRNFNRRFFTFVIVSAVCFSLVSGTLIAQEKPKVELSLKEAMKLALDKNFNVQLKALDTQNSYASLTGAFGIYDFTLSSDLNMNSSKSRQTSSFRGSENDSRDGSISLKRNFFTGGNATLAFGIAESESNAETANLNPSYGNDLTLTLNQPLLKGFGQNIVERQIIINRNNLKVSDKEFEAQIINTLVDVKRKYLDLVSAYDALVVAEDSLELAKQQLEINKIKVRIGTLPEIEIIQAEQQVASREANLIDAQIAITRADDSLKEALVMNNWETVIIPTDKLKTPDGTKFDFVEAFNKALENRTEVSVLDLRIKNNETSIEYAQNQTSMSLDVNARFVIDSSGGTFRPTLFGQKPPEGMPLSQWATITDMFGLENRSWKIGATFGYVFGNRAAEATLITNEVAKKQNILRKEQLRYTLAVEVRDAIRELEGSEAQLIARKKALEYSQKQYEAEKQKFDVGTSTNFEVLDFQNRLAQARNAVIVAQIRYNKALIEFDRATGTVLANNDVKIETEKEGIVGAKISN